MSEPDLRIDTLTGANVIVTPWRQSRPNLPEGSCPFCPGGLEAQEPYDTTWILNRWPALPDDRHEVILHSPRHDATFESLGIDGAVRVVEIWSERTAILGSRPDVGYVFIFENRGQAVGATIDHPHSQICAFGIVPPIPKLELSAGSCVLCPAPDEALVISRAGGWLARVPSAPSWPYEFLICTEDHKADLPAAGPRLRSGLGRILVASVRRLERVFGPAAPYLLWIHQRPVDGADWPAAHLHLHLAPVLRKPGVIRHLAAAELGAGIFFDPVDPLEAAAILKGAI